MSTPVSPTSSNSGTNNQTATTPNSKTAQTDQTMFLQLLVSELKNQDPMNPVQGTDFVTQLAQFQQLEQSISTGQDVSAMHTDFDQVVADFGGIGTDSTSGTNQS